MVVFCICRKLPMQNILCRTKPWCVFSLKYNQLCVHTWVCSAFKSFLVLHSHRQQLRFVFCLSYQQLRSKQSVSEGRKKKRTAGQQSNRQCLVPCCHLTFCSVSWYDPSCLGQPCMVPLQLHCSSFKHRLLCLRKPF